MKTVEYFFCRLCFNADVIEPLEENDSFVVHTPEGTFKLTKTEFYNTFPNVVKTKSYRERRLYHYKHIPKRIRPFQIIVPNEINVQLLVQNMYIDMVGNKIRDKIKELGELWHSSENNPWINVDKEVKNAWIKLIEQWVNNKDMPLIVRKNTSRKGQSFLHPSGREIIISDNTFAIWVFDCVIKGEIFTLSQLKEMLRCNKIPMVFMQTNDIKTKAKYSKTLGQHSLLGWKICHIESVGLNTNKNIEELDIVKIQDHFKKYASPDNMFVLPKEIGGLGEIGIFIEAQKDK